MSKLLAGAAAAALLFQPAANAVHGGEAADSIAADADISQFEKGDVNCDGQIKISDLVLLQKWLIGAGDTELNVSETADICEDGRVDIFDADNQYCGADIEKIVRPILDEKADIVIGERPIDQTEHFSWKKR